MDLEDLEAELSIILDEMEGPQGDYHEIYLRVRQMIQQMESLGMPPPDDLVQLEQRLDVLMKEEASKQDEGNQDEGNQDEGNQDEGNQDEGNQS